MKSCPSFDTLAGLGVEVAEGPIFDELEGHIEDCAACRSALEALVRDEPGGTASGGWPSAEPFDPPEIPGFAIEEELGRGTMGVVYRAWQSRLARRVALKVLRDAAFDGSRLREDWLREAHSGARVRDPRVVQIHDAGEANGCRYLVLDSGPGTPWASIAPKVADFGIARVTDDAGRVRATMRGPWGTPSYMAPEQVEADRLTIGPASDVYALGALLYEMLTGRPPFRAASLAETLEQIRNQEPVPPRRLNAAVPRDLETICLTCLAKDPARRYRTVDALADDLRRWRDGRPIAARPVAMAEHAWRWARRHPLTAALGAALAASLIVGLVGLAVLWRRAEAERRRAERLHEVALANQQVASRSLREICDFTSQMILDPRTSPTLPPYLGRALEETRARQLELSRRNALDPGGRRQLAAIDLMLAVFYRNHRQREDEARAMLYESIDLWEACLAEGADPDEARLQQLQALDYLASLGKDIRSEDELRRWEATSTLVYRQLCGNPGAAGELFGMSYVERQLADYLSDVGQTDRARRFLSQRLELQELLLRVHPESPDLRLARAMTRLALGEPGPVSIARCYGTADGAAPRGHRREMLILALAELTARKHGLRLLGTAEGYGPRADEDAAAWAEGAVRTLLDQAAPLGLDDDAVPTVAWRLREVITGMASHHRAVGKPREARRSARRFVALADAIVRTFPARAESYMLVCEAQLQVAKNASRTGDRATVERSLRSSLEAARQAAALDPERDEAREFVLNRMRRLAALEARGTK